MIYYYVCDSCGIFKELNFNPDQEIVYCDNPIHVSPVPLRILIPPRDEPLEELPSSIDSKGIGILDAFIGFVTVLAFLIAVGGFGLAMLVIVKLWLAVWGWTF